ncbi:Zn-dependent hydrolase [Siculibacillus lacustris]|uniref:Zn-dependent hydrolase n=1 Tax=Siculibacillus lacustris TaxID=1549641 RepID=A0A4Q9VUY8_9HYPH|nr:Zn-dependent hydrolase [Siculibacillus lacustris]TBW40041.1 Zn-dependent hydrolase [Siculibacillus lacustris]
MIPPVDIARLSARLAALGRVGALDGGGVSRLALTAADGAGRALVVEWMRAAELEVVVDPIGNIFATRPGIEPGPSVMIGSHIDTVATGGLYDGNLGVLAGLEVLAALDDGAIATRRPVTVAVFTNEEGARFQPDMLGSLVHVGGLDLAAALEVRSIDGTRLGDDLERIGFAGTAPLGGVTAAAYLELHIEQGPVLEAEGVEIGVVEGVQGISWTEVTLGGRSSHAGCTPMRLRHDAGLAAARIAAGVGEIARAIGGDMVGTVGSLRLKPDLVNVIAQTAVMTVDLRHPDEATLVEAEGRLAGLVARVAAEERVDAATRSLARFAPVAFDPALVARVEATAARLGHSHRRMPSGAGHDAQMLARVCPAAMIFVPSVDGLSHNVREHTDPADLARGLGVLATLALELAGPVDAPKPEEI